MEKKLTVNNLRVSFRTNSGKVQAVRDISFDIAKGETVAIVGESGSGKSVTARAILGILAPNAIVEGGEIIYDGQDLLKLSEENFHSIRGDKIAMIFQDPMSSLNPIMRVGKQLTEAMLLKGAANQRASRKSFNTLLVNLQKWMNLAQNVQPKSPEEAANIARCRNFDKFEYKHTELEGAYNNAREACDEAISEIDFFLFTVEKNAVKDAARSVRSIAKYALAAKNPYLVTDERIDGLAEQLLVLLKEKAQEKEYGKFVPAAREIREILKEASEKELPNFFAMGYYLTFGNQTLPELSISELNAYLRKYLDENFMLEFIGYTAKARQFSFEKSRELKREVIEKLEQALSVFKTGMDDKKAIKALVRSLVESVEASIDALDIVKDSRAYTFHSSLKDAVNYYYNSQVNNVRQQRRYDKAKAKFDKLVAANKHPDWEVPPASIVDLNLAKEKIESILRRLIESYRQAVTQTPPDFTEVAVSVIDYLKEKASGVVKKVSHGMAKNRALKLLEEVGINEPRRRFRQYPFEFSGGMRQRIVIAIALAANPDILICDEPTTALDVTIQSQILELINRLKTERQLSIMFITHDLGVVANMADRVAVMYAGKIVEYGTDEDIFYNPIHPYTWALLSSMPDLDTKEKLEAIPGTPPNMIYPPAGDAFAERNKYAMQVDFEMEPPMVAVSDTHHAATWLLHPDAPKVNPPKIITDRVKRYLKEAKRSGKQ